VVDEAGTGPIAAEHLRPSPIFLGLLALLAVAGWLAWIDDGAWTVFLFVVTGWVVSLCLHEFAHAFVAFHAGDRSVAQKGYLTLDPRRYADPGLSLVLPILFVLLGGIGLPGGAVWVDRGALRSRWKKSLMSFAGPGTNALVAVACLLPLGAGWIELTLDSVTFASGLAFLGFLQVTAVLLNLLPVPGLDGYGVVSPYLPVDLRAKLTPMGRWGIFVVFALLWIPGPNAAFFGVVEDLMAGLGVDQALTSLGYSLFRFWER
jgi:Zn-dependent protease